MLAATKTRVRLTVAVVEIAEFIGRCLSKKHLYSFCRAESQFRRNASWMQHRGDYAGVNASQQQRRRRLPLFSTPAGDKRRTN